MTKAVIGIGNILRRDDGIGVILVNKLREEKLPDIACIDAGIGIIHLLPSLLKYRSVIIVDAVEFNGEPGETKVFTTKNLKTGCSQSFSPHMFNILQLLEFYKELYRRDLEVTVFGIQPYDTAFGTSLSTILEEKLGDIKEKLIEVIQKNK